MQKYGLLGYPLGHSFSKTYFNQKFEAEKIDAEYLNFEIPSIKEIKNVIKENPELNGLNVTIPYKEHYFVNRFSVFCYQLSILSQ